MAQVRLLTAEDLIGLPDDYELYEGLPRGVAAAPDHSIVALKLAARILEHVETRQLGEAMGADASFRLSRDPDIVYLPDAAFVRGERIVSDRDLTFPFEGAPDLAVEVRSVSDSIVELDWKMHQYLAAGTRLGWLVDPLGRSVSVYRPNRPVAMLNDTDELDGEDVLPGLNIPINRVLRRQGKRNG